jgi:hypothetical protein
MALPAVTHGQDKRIVPRLRRRQRKESNQMEFINSQLPPDLSLHFNVAPHFYYNYGTWMST